MRRLWRIASSKALNLIIGIAGLVVGIYGIWFYHPRPALVLDTLSDTKVLDVHATLGKLDIVYGGESLKATNRELRLVVVRVINTGSADISKGSFDEDDPLGFKMTSGDLLEPPTVSASNDYLVRNVRLVQGGRNAVLLKPVILEAGEWIELKLLIAVQAGLVPTIVPLGKVAGVKRIRSMSSANERLTKPLWTRLVGADAFWIQLVRMPIYLVGLLIFLVVMLLVGMAGYSAAVFPFEKLIDWRSSRHRRRIAETYAKTREFRPTDHVVVDEYLQRGSSAITFIRKYIGSVAQHNADLAARSSILEHLQSKFETSLIQRMTKLRRPRSIYDFEEALRRGLQTEASGVVQVDPDLARAVDSFDHFLRAHGDVPPEDIPEDETGPIPTDPAVVMAAVSSEFESPLGETEN